jgi:putative ABC transport system permease protein
MPDWNDAIRARLKELNLEGAREREIIEELSDHLDERYGELVESGTSHRMALRIVLDELDTRRMLADELRTTRHPLAGEAAEMGSARGGNLMGGMWHDLKVAARAMRLNPGFSAAVVGMLALGIAGNTAIFSVFNGLFLRPLPFAEPARLVDLDETAPKWDLHYVGISNADFYTWQENNSTFDGMAVFTTTGANLSDPSGLAQRVAGAQVTYTMLDVLGLKPVVGRNFRAEEDRPGAGKVILLGYGLWRRLFSGDRDVAGRTLKLNETPFTIVGVLPKDAAVVPADADFWIPLAVDPKAPGGFYLDGVGRLKQGVKPERALADLTRIHKAVMRDGHPVNEDTAPILTPLREKSLGDFKMASRILLGGVVVVLLIACVNIAGLMMVRCEARSREIAIRTAVGASRSRVIRQLFTESLMLAVCGGVLGVAGGEGLLHGLVSLIDDNIPRWVRFDLDWRFALFAVGMVGAAAVLFGLAPAWQAARVETQACLQEAVRSTLTRGRRATLNALVAGEIALAVVLLAGAGLLLQAIRKVQRVDPGFRADNALTWSLRLPNAKYPKPEPRRALFQNLVSRLSALPGVTAASAASHVPLGGHSGYFFIAEGAPPLRPDEKNPVVLKIDVLPDYFRSMGITLLAGRDFTDTEQQSTKPTAVVINETFLRHFFPGATRPSDALGKRVRYYFGPADAWMQVVGVTHDTKHYGVEQEMKPSAFMPYGVDSELQMTFVLRTAVDPHTLVAPARDVIRQLDGGLAMYDVRTMTERLERSGWVRRAYSWLFAAFAVVAILLAAAGIYGVIAFAVSQRTRELGIRMALGARPGQLILALMANGMKLVAIGAVTGLAVALPAAGLLGPMLFGVSPRDVFTYAVVVLAVSVVGLVAIYLPARRASRVDPIRALRFE